MAAVIPEGEYRIETTCPHCDRKVEVPAVIEGVLKVKRHEAKMSVSAGVKAVLHRCDQPTLDEEIDGLLPEADEPYVDPETGEIL